MTYSEPADPQPLLVSQKIHPRISVDAPSGNVEWHSPTIPCFTLHFLLSCSTARTNLSGTADYTTALVRIYPGATELAGLLGTHSQTQLTVLTGCFPWPRRRMLREILRVVLPGRVGMNSVVVVVGSRPSSGPLKQKGRKQ